MVGVYYAFHSPLKVLFFENLAENRLIFPLILEEIR
jgi:hypothetical protein